LTDHLFHCTTIPRRRAGIIDTRPAVAGVASGGGALEPDTDTRRTPWLRQAEQSPGFAGLAVVGRELTLGYGTRVALASATFALSAGTLSAAIGPNGSGKSTLLNAIAGLAQPLNGTRRRA
jgi:ABC-type multidrug transport system fused ATPase/permease subunit